MVAASVFCGVRREAFWELAKSRNFPKDGFVSSGVFIKKKMSCMKV